MLGYESQRLSPQYKTLTGPPLHWVPDLQINSG